jgi:hypothetical protein
MYSRECTSKDDWGNILGHKQANVGNRVYTMDLEWLLKIAFGLKQFLWQDETSKKRSGAKTSYR